MPVEPFANLATRAAFFDELDKIAEAAAPQDPNAPVQDNKTKFKKWVKVTALTALGAGAGTAGAMGVDRLLTKTLGNTWSSMSPKAKMLTLSPLVGLATVGAAAASHKRMEAQHEALK